MGANVGRHIVAATAKSTESTENTASSENTVVWIVLLSLTGAVVVLTLVGILICVVLRLYRLEKLLLQARKLMPSTRAAAAAADDRAAVDHYDPEAAMEIPAGYAVSEGNGSTIDDHIGYATHDPEEGPGRRNSPDQGKDDAGERTQLQAQQAAMRGIEQLMPTTTTVATANATSTPLSPQSAASFPRNGYHHHHHHHHHPEYQQRRQLAVRYQESSQGPGEIDAVPDQEASRSVFQPASVSRRQPITAVGYKPPAGSNSGRRRKYPRQNAAGPPQSRGPHRPPPRANSAPPTHPNGVVGTTPHAPRIPPQFQEFHQPTIHQAQHRQDARSRHAVDKTS